VIAWPLAAIGAWFTVNLAVNWWTLRQRRRRAAAQEPDGG
jgi:cardiolipin synthase